VLVAVLAQTWGTMAFMRLADPNTGDEEHYRLAAQACRASATPRTAAATFHYLLGNMDVRQALSPIHAPT
jgi:hypothetical protein